MRGDLNFMRFIFFVSSVMGKHKIAVRTPLWDRVIASAIEGVAAYDAPGGHDAALNQAKFVDSLVSVMRAGWVKTTSIRRQCPRKGHLVETD